MTRMEDTNYEEAADEEKDQEDNQGNGGEEDNQGNGEGNIPNMILTTRAVPGTYSGIATIQVTYGQSRRKKSQSRRKRRKNSVTTTVILNTWKGMIQPHYATQFHRTEA